MFTPFNVKVLTKDMVQPLLQQMFNMASHSTDTSPEMSPFVSRVIDNCLLYAKPDCTQTLLQLVFHKFQKIMQSGLCLSFCCKQANRYATQHI